MFSSDVGVGCAGLACWGGRNGGRWGPEYWCMLGEGGIGMLFGGGQALSEMDKLCGRIIGWGNANV